MSARDELAKLLFITDNHSPDAEQDWLHLKPYGPKYLRGYYDEADAILAAGYTKPRTITTAEELDALPFKSVVMDHHGTVYHRWLRAGWQSAGPTLGHYRNTLPATVLYEPAP